MKRYLILLGVFAFGVQSREIIHRFHPIQVTASRLISSLAAETREVSVITRHEIEQLPVRSIPELMQYVGSMDIQQRGFGSVQADFNLRGSSFEQVVILLNGVRLNDPKTGHHNADIPVSLEDIDRIEILHGHASSMYGPEGYGGVINIVTRQAAGNQTRLSVTGGSYGTIGSSVSQQLKTGRLSSVMNLEHYQSDGYRPDTDFKNFSVSCISQWKERYHTLHLTTGWIEKDFGANGFYAPYPSREKTRSLMTIFHHTYHPLQYIQWDMRIYGRRHHDHFILDSQIPEWYQNKHWSQSYGAESVLCLRMASKTQVAVGCDYIKETMESSSLGDREHNRFGVFGEIVMQLFRRIIINSGLRMDCHDQWGTQISPSVNFAYTFLEGFNCRVAGGRIFRAPTFTELYYNSPSNIGNPDLKPEHGWNIETGCDVYKLGYIMSMTLFQRSETDRIDWITMKKEDPWSAVNIGSTKIQGLSASVSRDRTNPFSWKINYTWLNQIQSDRVYRSKYQFRVLRHHLNMCVCFHGPWDIVTSCQTGYRKRQKESGYWLLSAKLSRDFKTGRCFLEAINLQNTVYQEVIDIPMPGRHFMGGVELKMKY
ncbi:TonB-dependent receptor [bacterium]|nr:TonB-dependent receptor [bacterium]